jgi:hypothetical protein
VGKVQFLSEFIMDLQESSACGAARSALAMCLARNPNMDFDETTYIVTEGANPEKLLQACEGYDHRIAKNLDYNAFYNKIVLEKDHLQEDVDAVANAGADAGGSELKLFLGGFRQE